MGPYIMEEPRIAGEQAGAKPVTLAPAPPSDANAQHAMSVQPQPFRTPNSAQAPTGVLAWAGGAVIIGAALIAWAVASRARVAKAHRAVRGANAEASASDAGLAEDMQELTDRLAQELDVRAQRLERLIVAADERIARLESLETRLGAGLDAAQRAARPARVPTTPLAPAATSHAEPKPAGDAGVLVGGAGDPSIAAVYTLADQGMSAVQIAQRTGRATGQVELILNLRRAAMG
jgi:hypothetical protein